MSIVIPSCSAIHVLGETTVHLSKGELTLIEPQGSNDNLILTIGPTAAFAISSSTLFGTLTNDPRAYVFSPDLTTTNSGTSPQAQGGGQGGYVKIMLPDVVAEDGNELQKAQEAFEGILIKHGLLKEGLAAIGDEITRGLTQDASSAENWLKTRTGTGDGGRGTNRTSGSDNGIRAIVDDLAESAPTISLSETLGKLPAMNPDNIYRDNDVHAMSVQDLKQSDLGDKGNVHEDGTYEV